MSSSLRKHRRGPGILLPILLLPLLLSGCGDGEVGSGVEVRDPWVRPMAIPAGEEGASSGVNSAAYMVFLNRGPGPDRFLGGVTEAAGAVELHESFLDGEVMRMQEVGPVELPVGEDVALRPGGLHLMLLNLREPLVVGDTISLTLTFQASGALEVLVPVRGGGGM